MQRPIVGWDGQTSARHVSDRRFAIEWLERDGAASFKSKVQRVELYTLGQVVSLCLIMHAVPRRPATRLNDSILQEARSQKAALARHGGLDIGYCLLCPRRVTATITALHYPAAHELPTNVRFWG
jgi:hypothetical protein